jgi:hypothetical protein
LWTWWYSNECFRHLPRRPLVHLTYFFKHYLRLFHLPKHWKEAKFVTFRKRGSDPEFPQKLRPISLVCTTDKQFEKVILKIVQRHPVKRSCFNAHQFDFRVRHRTTLTNHDVTLNFNNNMSKTAAFLDIKKSFDVTWHFGLLYKLSELKCSISLIKHISSVLSQRNFRVPVEGEIFTPREMQAVVPQSSVLSTTLYSIYIYILK